MAVNLIPKGHLPIAHNFSIFSNWMENALEHQYQVIQDQHRENTFLAIDAETNVVGMFLMTENVWGGFIFDSYFDRVLFEAGQAY